MATTGSQSLAERLEQHAAELATAEEAETGINARVGDWVENAHAIDIDDIDARQAEDNDDSTDFLSFSNPNLANQFAKGNLIFYVPPTAPRPGQKQQETDPLLKPPDGIDYKGIERLKQILLPDDKGSTCMRLLDGRELVRYIAEGGKMKRRQDLEKSHPHLFASEQLVQMLLDETAKKRTQCDLNGEEFIFFPGIVALSYAWADPQHPDPQGAQMQMLGPVAEWYLSERSRLRQRIKRPLKSAAGLVEGKITEAEAPNTVMFGMFVDYMCLHQAPFTEAEEEYYKRAQFNVGMLYAHEQSVVFQAPVTPGGEGDRMWAKRGWCRLERRLAELVAQPEYLIDISKFEHCRLAKKFEFGTTAAYKKTGTKLASQGDGQLTVTSLKAERIGLPVFVQDFRKEMWNHVFTFPDDMDVCVKIYTTCSRPLLAEKEELLLSNRKLGNEEWEQLPGMINICEALNTVVMRECGMSGRVLQQIFRNIQETALSALTYLDLSLNEQIGDTGAGVLAEALGMTSHLDTSCCGMIMRRGKANVPIVLSRLRYLMLEKCGIRERGGAMMLEAVGKARDLGVLVLSHNNIGDAGMRGFDRLRAGELQKMLDLQLVSCGFGDVGMCSMVEAMSLGVMPKIEASGEAEHGKGKVNLGGNAYPQAREAFAAVLREREGGASQLFRSQTSSAAAIARLRAALGK